MILARARQAIGENSGSVTGIVSSGYAPPEQYLSDATKQGAWTDLYALGATLYRCISGADPTDAHTRQTALTNREADPLRPAQDVGKGRYSPGLLSLIDDQLQLPVQSRSESAEAVLKSFAVPVHEPKQHTDTHKVGPTGTHEVTKDGRKEAKPKQHTGTYKVTEDEHEEAKPKQHTGTHEVTEDEHEDVRAAGQQDPQPVGFWRRAAAGVAGAALLAGLGVGLWRFQFFSEVVVKPGSLVLELTPADAQVILPGTESPYRPGLELPAGVYRVVVRRAGYEEFEDTLRIDAGQRTIRVIALVEKPGSLMLELTPADAQVTLPDIGPRYRPGLELAAGDYRVVVRRAGYEEFDDILRIDAGRRTTRAITLRRAVGAVFRDALKSGGEGPEMVVLPTGRFLMGSKGYERDRYDDEGPVRMVTIVRPIAMGRYETTFADYDRFARATGRDLPEDRGWGDRANRPVIYVSQKDAQAYAAWLSEETGNTYRLPSEAEWEYAARAGTSTRYSWGDEIGRNRANCYDCGSKWDNKQTAPVGSFAANAFGLHDLHGNVWEWVKDCWHENYKGAPSDGSARTTGCDGRSQAVLRGGSWGNPPQGLRSARHNWTAPSARNIFIGFRLVRDINP